MSWSNFEEGDYVITKNRRGRVPAGSFGWVVYIDTNKVGVGFDELPDDEDILRYCPREIEKRPPPRPQRDPRVDAQMAAEARQYAQFKEAQRLAAQRQAGMHPAAAPAQHQPKLVAMPGHRVMAIRDGYENVTSCGKMMCRAGDLGTVTRPHYEGQLVYVKFDNACTPEVTVPSSYLKSAPQQPGQDTAARAPQQPGQDRAAQVNPQPGFAKRCFPVAAPVQFAYRHPGAEKPTYYRGAVVQQSADGSIVRVRLFNGKVEDVPAANVSLLDSSNLGGS